MKKIHSLVIASGLGLVASLFSVAHAADLSFPVDSNAGLYARAGAAYGFFGDFKNAAGPTVALGGQFNGGRQAIEAEFAQFASKTDYNLKVNFTPILLNYRYSIRLNQTGLTGYLGGSIGAMREELKGWYSNYQQTAFAGGLNVGISYAVAKDFGVDFGVKVLGIAETDIATRGSVSILSLGLKYKF